MLSLPELILNDIDGRLQQIFSPPSRKLITVVSFRTNPRQISNIGLWPRKRVNQKDFPYPTQESLLLSINKALSDDQEYIQKLEQINVDFIRLRFSLVCDSPPGSLFLLASSEIGVGGNRVALLSRALGQSWCLKPPHR